MSETLEVLVEREKCCGYGNCVVAAPDVFTLDDEDGIVRTLDPHPPADLREAVRDAAAACPAEAIVVRG